MITVTVTTGEPPSTKEVSVAGFDRLTPKAARAALEMVGARVGRVYYDGFYVTVYEKSVSNKFEIGVGRKRRQQQTGGKGGA